MKPYISIIIPVYNSWGSLFLLLESLKKSTYKNFEVIIGDDASHTEKPAKLLRMKPTIVRLPLNQGPAAARNAAAKRALGRVLVFLDSDVIVYPDTLAKIAEKFTDDADLTALTGVWDKYQHTKTFFPQFKALRDWSYWTNERESDGYYYLFSTRIAAIKREVFLRLGGFNESFRQMEDVEITYRIARRYAIIFTPDVRVHHEFEGFVAVGRKYFWRSYYWSRLYSTRRKFDPVATTVWESFSAASAVAALGSLLLVKFVPLGVFVGFFLLHIFFLRKFFRFVFREKGFVFMMKSLVTGMVLYCIIAAGSLYWVVFSYKSRQIPRHLEK